MEPKKERIWYHGAWRSPEGVIRRRALSKDRKRKTRGVDNARKRAARKASLDNNPALREKERKKGREYYRKNKEKEAKRKNKYAKKNRAKVNAIQRKCYERNRERNAKRSNDRRRRRDPTIGLHTAIRAFRKGEISLSELIKRFSGALDKVSKICDVLDES